MDNNRNARTALDWAPEGKRSRPKETCSKFKISMGEHDTDIFLKDNMITSQH
jgi:hypothetical protein